MPGLSFLHASNPRSSGSINDFFVLLAQTLQHTGDLYPFSSNMPVRRSTSDFNSAQDSFNAAQSSFQTTSTVISVGAIVGIVVSVVAFVSIGIAIACILNKRSKRRAAMFQQPTYATGYVNTTYGPPPVAAPDQTYPSPPSQSYQTNNQTRAEEQPLKKELVGNHVHPNQEFAGSYVYPPVEMPAHDAKHPQATTV